MSSYIRDDIYFCPCCGFFYSTATDAYVDIPPWELPVEVAVQVMRFRDELITQNHPPRKVHQRDVKKNIKNKGFSRIEKPVNKYYNE